MADSLDLLRGQTGSRSQDDGETPLDKAATPHQLRMTSAAGHHLVDGDSSDSEEGNSPNNNDAKHGSEYVDKSLYDKYLPSYGRGSELEEASISVTDAWKRVRGPKLLRYRERKTAEQRRLREIDEKSTALHPRPSPFSMNPRKIQSKIEEVPETQELRQKAGSGTKPLSREEEDGMNAYRERFTNMGSVKRAPWSKSSSQDPPRAQSKEGVPEKTESGLRGDISANPDGMYHTDKALYGPDGRSSHWSSQESATSAQFFQDYLSSQGEKYVATIHEPHLERPQDGKSEVCDSSSFEIDQLNEESLALQDSDAEPSVREMLGVSPESCVNDLSESDLPDESNDTLPEFDFGDPFSPNLFDPADEQPVSVPMVPTLLASPCASNEKTGHSMGQSSATSPSWKTTSPGQTSEWGHHSFTSAPSSVGNSDDPSFVKRARNTFAARKSRPKGIERTEQLEEQLEMNGKALSGQEDDSENRKEAALAETFKTHPASGQASPVLTPRALSPPDQRTDMQERKHGVKRNVSCTQSQNNYHRLWYNITHWLGQSYCCSQSNLINMCNHMRGSRRISWTCECGMRAHWDLSSHTSDTKAAALVASLDKPNNAHSSKTGCSDHDSGSSPSPSPRSQQSDNSDRHASTPPTSASENEDGDIWVDIQQRQEAESTEKPLKPRFIELCINDGRYKKIVAEINLTEMETDAALFIAIAEQYRLSRNRRGYVAVKLPQFLGKYMKIPSFECCFIRPSDIIFRKFLLYQHQSPEIAICKPGLPPECEVNEGRYDYKPCPMERDEIMPAHHFFHILDDPVPHTSDTWTQRLPKKLHDSLLSTREQSAPISWGIHIIETPNWYLIFLAVFLILLASGAFSITWAAVTKDVQGGFGMGGYVVAVLTAGMTALFFKCSDER